MNGMARILVISFTVLSLIGCAVKPVPPVFNQCENTFVLADPEKIYFFEHEKKSVKFHLLKQYDDYGSDQAFLDCKRNIIVSPYDGKGIRHDQGGVTIFDLKDDSSNDYSIYDEGVGMVLARYKNGVLLAANLIHRDAIKESDDNYVPPGERYTDDAGKRWKVYEPTLLFDLDQRKVVKRYNTGVANNQLIGDTLFSQQANAITKIDLRTGHVQKLFEPTDVTRGWLPGFSLTVFSGEDYYLITAGTSNNVDNYKLVGFEKSTIYKLEHGKMVKQISLPYNDLTYAVAPEESIYIFTRHSQKVLQFDPKTRKITEYDLKLPIPEDWRIESVGYTRDNFIISVNREGYLVGGVFVVQRDLSEVSRMYELPMALIDVTTQQNIFTHSNLGLGLTWRDINGVMYR
jgi:hypothetical protein